MKLLSIIKKTKTEINTNKTYFSDNLDTIKHFPSSVREWNNSIFSFNKNALSLIPNISNLAIKIIRNYFYLYNKKIERKLRRKVLSRKFRLLSTSRVFLSKGEFKHTNNKVIITLYVFNKQKNNYLYKLKKRYLNKFLKKILSFKNKTINSNDVRLANKLILLKKFNKIGLHGLKALEQVNWYKPKIVKILRKLYEKRKINKYVAVSKYVNKFYKKLIKRSLRKLIFYMYYRQLIYINKSKFNYTYLQYLKNKLQLLFNKNIEFNFIDLKYFYLNSNILSESILLKITKNRRNLLRHLTYLRNKVIIQKKKIILGDLLKKRKLSLKEYFNNKDLLESYIINNLKYKHITGFRIEAKGRLNKRFTASRSISKVKYKGNLLNLDSSYKGLSSVLLKGNLNSNLQFTKLNSKTRIGAFGIKGWVSGY